MTNTSAYPLSVTKLGQTYRLDTYAYNVSTRNGVHIGAQLRGASSEVSGRNGSLYTPYKKRDNGRIVLEMWVVDTDPDGAPYYESPNQYEAWLRNLGMLKWLFDTSASQIVLTEWVGGYNDADNAREALVEVTAIVEPEYQSVGYSTLKVECIINDSFWQSSSQYTFTSPVGTTAIAKHSLAALTGSTAPIDDAEYKVTGPITNPTIVDSATGHICRYNGTVPAGSRWYVNSATWQSGVTTGDAFGYKDADNVTSTTTSYGAMAPRLMSISPRNIMAPEVELRGSGTASGTKLEIKARKKFH